MRTLGLIPARGGSTGIPRKNIRSIAGKPLIGWTIEAAHASRLDAVVVSTEDEEIARVARASGAEVPFMRPRALATDETPGIEPVMHAIDALPGYDAVLLLQPTSPLRSAADIEGLMTLAATTAAPAIVSVCLSADHPYWTYRLGSEGRLERLIEGPEVDCRQDLPSVYVLNGAMYYAETDWLKAHRTFIDRDTIGYPMPQERSVDIDGLLDWQLAELLLANRAATAD